jgi:hypothetical protein
VAWQPPASAWILAEICVLLLGAVNLALWLYVRQRTLLLCHSKHTCRTGRTPSEAHSHLSDPTPHALQQQAAEFVTSQQPLGTSSSSSAGSTRPQLRLGATVTPQHMLLNRNALFAKGLRPHNYCLPILKREKHRERAQAICGWFGCVGRGRGVMHRPCVCVRTDVCEGRAQSKGASSALTRMAPGHPML